MAELERRKLSDLLLDDHNANRGTVRGRELLSESLRERGAGRSILVDKHGRIIAGNKTAEQASAAGFEDVLIVKTDGKTLVAVEREDLDLSENDTARMLAYDDNRSNELNLLWDPEIVAADFAEIPLSSHFTEQEVAALTQTLKEDTSFFESILAEAGEEEGSPLDPNWNTLSGAAGDFVQIILVVTPGERDAIFAKINAAKTEHDLPSQGAALCHLLGIG